MIHFNRAVLVTAGVLAMASQVAVADSTFTHAPIATVATVTVAKDRQPLYRQVQYGDLDLSSPKGMKTLNTRIRAAVRYVCPREDPRKLESIASVRKCRMMATDEAMLQVQRLASPQGGTLSAGIKR